MRARARLLLALGATCVVLLTACAEPVDDRAVTSASWLELGEELQDSASAAGEPAPNLLLSEPVDITEPGDVVLRAGPIDPTGPLTSGGVMLPPDLDDHAVVRVARGEGLEPRVVERAGARYVEYLLEVSDVVRPYEGLRAWVEWGDGPMGGT